MATDPKEGSSVVHRVTNDPPTTPDPVTPHLHDETIVRELRNIPVPPAPEHYRGAPPPTAPAPQPRPPAPLPAPGAAPDFGRPKPNREAPPATAAPPTPSPGQRLSPAAKPTGFEYSRGKGAK
jgi:hypothetical protein